MPAMKTAIYIEEGVTQLVLTPQNDWEQQIVNKITTGEVELKHGSFYETQGGWYRSGYDTDDKSLIILLKKLPANTVS